MIQPEKDGPQPWASVHETFPTTVAEIYNVDNVGPHGSLLSGWEMFRTAGEDLDALIQQARAARKRILPIGAGWALSKINITDGWLVNTKLLNGCYDVADKYFDPAYPAERRPNLVLAQAGMQIAELNTYLELLPRVEGQRRALHAAGIGTRPWRGPSRETPTDRSLPMGRCPTSSPGCTSRPAAVKRSGSSASRSR
jgi:hypothetical protein